MNQNRYKVDAVHSTLKRVITSNLTYEKLRDLINELMKAGYEKENILIEKYNIHKEKSIMEVNVRYGIVNESDRTSYEKKWQVPMGYFFITYDKEKAIDCCRKKGRGWIVEKISHIPDGKINFKVTIYRGGK